ncbi:histidine phosphatase family protein [Thalassospira australica]|uniref:histidine phosphatase family protein n=1 Tax=Thalassospira australica TaxID=1528106 RepID=UPI0038506BD8
MCSFIRNTTVFVALIYILAPHSAKASDANPWEIWSQPGVHAMMRHAIAPGTGDPANFVIGDCETQRNLDDTGRNQARATGERMREMGISLDFILSSQWCRCLETANLLGLGPVTGEPALNSFFRDSSTKKIQTDQIIDRLGALPEDSNVLLITHQVNITALTGVYPRSGEIILIRLDDNDVVKVLARLMP